MTHRLSFSMQDLLRPTLKDISVRLESGDLLAVIGPVGSGKVLPGFGFLNSKKTLHWFFLEFLSDESSQGIATN